MQPTPALGIRADGSDGNSISLERAVAGCGVDFIEAFDPYNIKRMSSVIKKAADYVDKPEGGIAVIIARHPCVIAYPDVAIPQKKKLTITDDCMECNFCLDRFECPALYHDQELGRVNINIEICVDCSVCIQVCPKGAIVEA